MSSKQLKVVTSSLFPITIALAAAVFFYGKADPVEAQDAAQAPPAMPVTVVKVEPQAVQLWQSYSGRLSAVDIAEIRPQVSGEIKAINFEDGERVEKDQVLFTIDPRVYRADVEQAEADWIAAKNQAEYAQREKTRGERLVKQKAISEGRFDELTNLAKVAIAQEKAAVARLERARINLDFAHVKAPFSGRVSRAEITVGNLIESGPNAPLLTTVVSDEGIYADFDVDEHTYLQLVQAGASDSAKEKAIPVVVNVGALNESFSGYLQSFDNRIDTNSGTIRARAFFTNEQKQLLPGMFVNVKLGQRAHRRLYLNF